MDRHLEIRWHEIQILYFVLSIMGCFGGFEKLHDEIDMLK